MKRSAPAKSRHIDIEEKNILQEVLTDPVIEDFEIVKVITKTQKGHNVRPAMVRLAVHKKSGKYCILKSIIMKECKDRDRAHFFTERQLLREISSPFGVKYLGTFASSRQAYIILEYIPGKEMFVYTSNHLLNETYIRFYVAQILLFLETLQSKGAIHRDIKTENILLSNDGYIRVIDYGYARYIPKEQLSDTCGTWQYLCPQKFWRTTYSEASDMWSLGILIFEMFRGVTPFGNACTYMDLSRRYFCEENLWRHVEFKGIPPLAQDLIKRLCVVKPADRLTAVAAKSHAWFEGIDWKAIFEKRVPPPSVDKLNAKLMEKQRKK